MQNTLKTSVTFDGVGLHSGLPVKMILRPAPAGHGISFQRTDIELGNTIIPARWDMVERTALCTRLVNEAGVVVSTVEHIMAALAGCGVHNALVELDGPEVPIVDGSSAPFVRGIMKQGLHRLTDPVVAYEVLKPITVEHNGAKATLLPSDRTRIEFHIDFTDEAIGRQSKSLDLRNGAFARELCDSRTFCSRSDVETMQANGLALGGVPGENAIVFDGKTVESGTGLRHEDEPVRHKMLDALGDLALAGGPLIGHYVGERAGHALTNTLLRELFATPGAVREVTCDLAMAMRLPGQGLIWSEIPTEVARVA
ncbi:UDP-3-O-acyl-N-acetylglucosamine deacetylase [Parasedimentitalea maritima]|uniref:UDP-3-O-acyl-N-acetylglucosamine deacetylase n=1 Tax=Parasedimentitalea maritima TaxID=2578117 RepID=A0A5R8ZRZ6_9RHOB|nr:UDP-3-O-acyl-N-acetylglucosamine deacetylase [Zongyanglinia marina]KAE9629585.1 UDP-3-O-acyl-N-acetylglucosamine deacetylase [Zongyanglinia marina]TLP67824.1 UDP-3-O-acyl-N-acetylglucosamine deacetylase [Zongyanglinia marina]